MKAITARFLVLLVALGLVAQISSSQTKPALVSGILYRIHPGFLEVRADAKNVIVVKVDSATVYWNGRTDKAASAKGMAEVDELIIEVIEKKGLPLAQKVRFLHATQSCTSGKREGEV